MNSTVPNRIVRTAVLAALVMAALWAADTFGASLTAKERGWGLLALAAIFLISEAFFWRGIDAISKLPIAESIDSDEAESLARRVNEVKRNLISRWFMVVGLQAVTAGCALILTQDEANSHPRIPWLIGVGFLVCSLPVVLSFFRIWRQAEDYKTQQFLAGKKQGERKQATDALSKEPAKPLNADEALKGYTKVVPHRKSASSK